MKRLAAVTALVAVLVLASCSAKGQSFREAVELVCESPTKIPDGRTKLTEAVMAVEPKVKNAKALELFQHLAQVETGEKSPLLRMAMNDAGLTRCTLLEIWEAQRENPPKLPADPLAEPIP